MAKAMSMIKRREKKVRVTRTESYAINRKYLGDEPTYPKGHVLSDSEKAASFRWYNYMCTTSDARDYVEVFLKRRGMTDELKMMREVPDASFPMTAAWISRLEDIGIDIGASAEFVLTKIRESERYAKTQKEDDTAETKPTIRDNLDKKVSAFIADIEVVLDKRDFSLNVYEALKANSFPTTVVNKIGDYYVPLREELQTVIANTDPDLYEGYRRFKKKDIEEELQWVNTLIHDCKNYGSNEKKLRAPKQKKPQSVEKKLKNFVYKKEDLELKLASVNPAEVIGAQEVWLLDCKYRALTVLRARGPGGLDVERRSITGYDEENSETKSVGKKAGKWAEEVKSRGKVTMKKIMSEIQTKKWNDTKFRSSEDTVVLRVFR